MFASNKLLLFACLWGSYCTRVWGVVASMPTVDYTLAFMNTFMFKVYS